MYDVSNDELADLLAKSRDRLKEEGWVKGEFRLVENKYAYDDDSDEAEIIDYDVLGYCAMGAGLYELGIDEQDCSSDRRTLALAYALAKAADLDVGHTPGLCTKDGICSCTINAVTHWNDNEDRTEQEVLDAFMKAEKDARSGNVDE
jgi:hypothetical protein